MLFSFILNTLALSVSIVALPTKDNLIDLPRRQDIDFALADSLPDPTNTSSTYNETSAIEKVIADVDANPLPQIVDVNRRDTSGYGLSISLKNAAINAPLNCNGSDTYMGSKLWNDDYFDEGRCAAACTAQSVYNLKYPPVKGPPRTCQFYNTYVLLKNGGKQGQYCALYTQAWDVSKATNTGQWRGNDHYTISQSLIASNSTNSGEGSCPQDVPYVSGNGQDFCTSYIGYTPTTVSVTTTVFPTAITTTALITQQLVATSFTILVQSHSTTETATVLLPPSDDDTDAFASNAKRAIQVPASVSTWSSSRISAACSAVATGTSTIIVTVTGAAPVVSVTSTTTQTKVVPGTITSDTTATTTTTVTKVASYSPTATLNTNGDFEISEDDDVPYWYSESGNAVQVYDPAVVFNGSASLMIANNLVHPSKDGYPDTVSQVLTFLDPTSSQYHLSFYYHTELKNVDCVLTVRGEGGRQIYFNDFDPEPATVGKYQYTYVSVENITPPSSLAVLVFTWQCSYNKGTSGKVYLDDVYFTSGVLV